MNFKKWVKSIQTAGYNGAHTVSVKYPCMDEWELGREVPLYTVLHKFRQVLFLAGNQDSYKNRVPSMLPYHLSLIFMGMKNFFWSNLIQFKPTWSRSKRKTSLFEPKMCKIYWYTLIWANLIQFEKIWQKSVKWQKFLKKHW